MEFYSAIENKLMSFSGKWMGLEVMMLSEISQTQTSIMCFLAYVESRFKKRYESISGTSRE
jgi:hypothetical protein